LKFPNGKNIISHRFVSDKNTTVKSVFICVQYKILIDKVVVTIFASTQSFEGLLCVLEVSILPNKWFTSILNNIFKYTKIIQVDKNSYDICNKFLLFLLQIKINTRNKTVEIFHRNLFFIHYDYFIDARFTHCLKSKYKKKNTNIISYFYDNKFYDMIMLQKKIKLCSVERVFNYIDLKEIK
jgi:hypothetical protein